MTTEERNENLEEVEETVENTEATETKEEVVEEKPKTTLDSIVSLFASKEGKK